MGIEPKIEILGRRKLPRIGEINPLKRKRGQTQKRTKNRALTIRDNTLQSPALVAGATRLELATSGVTGRRSNQLNYAPAEGW